MGLVVDFWKLHFENLFFNPLTYLCNQSELFKQFGKAPPRDHSCWVSAKTRYWCWSGFFYVISLVQKKIYMIWTSFINYLDWQLPILIYWKFQDASITHCWHISKNMLQKWPFLSVMQSHLIKCIFIIQNT